MKIGFRRLHLRLEINYTMKLKTFTIAFAIVMIVPTGIFAQPWLNRDIPSAGTPARKPNLKDISERFDSYWKGKEISFNEEENREEGGYQQFKRWEWFMRQRTYPSGNFFDPHILFREYEKFKATRATDAQKRTQSTQWTLIGPAVVPNSGGDVGRINVLRFNPQNLNTLYIGAASGGFWMSHDGGNSWATTTDFLTALSIADIAVDLLDTNNIYVATGDGYGYEVGGDFWGGTYSAGVLKSTDGGLTWNSTGLTYTQDQNDIIQRLAIRPDQPNVLIAATRNGLFRTTNGGTTWTSVSTGHFYDIEFNPLHPDTVLATKSDQLYRSINGGATWSLLYSGLGSGRLMIGVTAANVNVIYASNESSQFSRSSNGGTSFVTMSSPSIASFYGYYDDVLAVSQVDENTVYCGGYAIAKTTDGGNTWNQAANNGGSDYVHADNHFIDFLPGSNNTVFSCNDGGIFKTTDGGTSWTDLGNGLAIKQYYRMSQSASDPYTIYAGAQDNGSDQLTGGVWTQVYGADGMDNQVDWSDDQNVYVSYQYGAIQKSTNGGASFSDISPSSGDWVTPFVIDPVNSQTLYAGYGELYKSTDGGLSWNTISNGMTGGSYLIALTVAQNHDYIYTATFGSIFMTSNGGNTWTDITGTLPTSSAGITYIAVSDSDPLKVWVSLTGYSSGNKIFASTDGGQTWTNFSTGIPNIPVNCIVFQNGSQDILYAGTDFGVFYTQGGAAWTTYGTDFPNVIVSDMDIHYGASKLRTATYGRGIWETDLAASTLYALDAGVQAIISPSASACDSTLNPQIQIYNYGADTLTTLTINYGLDGNLSNQYVWTGSLPHAQSATISLPVMYASNGNHTFTATATNPNGGVDLFSGNDSRTSNFLINVASYAPPFAEDFESGTVTLPDFIVSDNAALFSSVPYGAFGLSNYSLKADYYNVSSGTSTIRTKKLDFTNAVPPIIFSFDHAYAVYSSSYHDSLKVSVSTDCGTTFSTYVYVKGDNSLATAPTSTSQYYPQSSEWVHDTIDLSWLNGQSGIIVQMEFKTGFGNNLYVDNIDVYDQSNSVSTPDAQLNFAVYPNPSSDVFYVTVPAVSGKTYDVELNDLSGRVVYSYKGMKGSGIEQTVIPASGFARGIYFCTLHSSTGERSSLKVIKN